MTTIRLRRDTAAAWASANPVLQAGEPGYDLTAHTLKVGDGSTAWSSLAGIAGGGGSGSTIDVTAAPYNADDTGATDAAAAIQSALTAAGLAGGGVVYLPTGQYLIQSTTLVVPTGVTLVGDGDKSVLLQGIWPTSSGASVTGGTSMLNTAGTIGSKLSCSSVAAKATTITGISSTAGMAAGDWLLLGSTNAYWSGYSTRYKGELLRISSVDSASQVTVLGIVRDSYTSSPGVFRVTMVEDVTLRNFAIRNTEPGVANAHATSMIGLLYSHHVRVEGLHLINSDYTGVKVTTCSDVIVQGCTMRDFTDNSPDGQWGYGVMAELATEKLVVDSCTFARLRHSFTTGGIAGSYGGPKGIVVSNCITKENTNTAYDTHQIGQDIEFVGNVADGCSNSGFTVRSLDTRIIGNSVSYCSDGIYVYGVSDGIGNGCTISGNTLRHLWNGDGIVVTDADSCSIIGNLIDSCAGSGVYVTDAAQRLVVKDNLIQNTAIVNGSRKAGVTWASGITSAGHIVQGNLFRNLAGGVVSEIGTTGGMTYAIETKSANVTGSWFIDNRCTGMASGTILDLGGNYDINNVNLDAVTRALPDMGHRITGRAECIPRYAATASINLTSGTMLLGYLTPDVLIAATSLIVYAASTASATITLGRLGLYSVAANGDITLVQGSTNDTALLGTQNTKYAKTITLANCQRGVRYAVGILMVGTTAGSVRGASGISDMSNDTVRMAGAVTGQTDLPNSVANASITVAGNIPYVGVSA